MLAEPPCSSRGGPNAGAKPAGRASKATAAKYMQGESPKSLRDQRRRASLAALCIYKIKPHEAQHQIAKSWTPSLRISGPLLSKSDMLLRLRLFVEPCRGQNCKSRAQLQCKNCTPFLPLAHQQYTALHFSCPAWSFPCPAILVLSASSKRAVGQELRILLLLLML